ncbi:hypothetical protein CSHISOI_09199 [Colletotrichum shisoi]|uniref:DUF6590 domain-containing protein n=1 Tax=Colletotrichum shisoi TaxID=2078593 RepID=A0A5Q4BH19_9PEZI|nr:hypothetical protein CSHISOI_09199 [Colletotrichum shisoi]
MVIGNRDFSTFRSKSTKSTKSDSGNGDDASIGTHDSSYEHPLARKGYDIGPASRCEVGDVFEFLWADSHEFEWEWKCLGYTRFIVLRHSDTFPHHCVCVPISTPTKNDFQKPGIDSSQQGYVFDENDRTPPFDRLPFSPVGMQLRPGKFHIKENSRANYADVLEIDHDAQVMVVGDVTRYFDRVRRNVNKAVMRNVLKKALEQYRQGKLVGKKGAKLEASEVNGGGGGSGGGQDDDDDDEPEGESDPDHPDVFLMPDETASVIEKRQPESPLIISSSSSAAAAAAEMPPPPPPAPLLPPMDMPMPMPMPIPIQQPSPPRDDAAASIRSHTSHERRHYRKEARSPPQDDTASIRSHASLRERRHSRKEAPPPPRGEDLPRKMSDQHVDGASRPYRQRIDLPRSRSHRLPEPETGSMYDVATARAD